MIECLKGNEISIIFEGHFYLIDKGFNFVKSDARLMHTHT